jgi:hypothetical protein
MLESFVDVSYRGLELGRRLKLRDVQGDVAYLEIPLPMPVGTRLEIATDEGARFEAEVTAVHEQVGGSAEPPGMAVRPLALGAAAAWWAAHAPAPAPAAPGGDDNRITQVMSTEAVEAALESRVPEGLVDDGRRTTVMNALEIEAITRTAGEAGEDEPEITVESGDGEVSGEMAAASSGPVNGKKTKGGARRSKRKKRGSMG